MWGDPYESKWGNTVNRYKTINTLHVLSSTLFSIYSMADCEEKRTDYKMVFPKAIWRWIHELFYPFL